MEPLDLMCDYKHIDIETQKLLGKDISEWGKDELIQALIESRDALRAAIEGRLTIKRIDLNGIWENIPVYCDMRDWVVIGEAESGREVECVACLAGCYFISHVINERGLQSMAMNRADSIIGFLDHLRYWEEDGSGPMYEYLQEILERLGLPTSMPWMEQTEYDHGDPILVLRMLDTLLEPVQKALSLN